MKAIQRKTIFLLGCGSLIFFLKTAFAFTEIPLGEACPGAQPNYPSSQNYVILRNNSCLRPAHLVVYVPPPKNVTGPGQEVANCTLLQNTQVKVPLLDPTELKRANIVDDMRVYILNLNEVGPNGYMPYTSIKPGATITASKNPQWNDQNHCAITAS